MWKIFGLLVGLNCLRCLIRIFGMWSCGVFVCFMCFGVRVVLFGWWFCFSVLLGKCVILSGIWYVCFVSICRWMCRLRMCCGIGWCLGSIMGCWFGCLIGVICCLLCCILLLLRSVIMIKMVWFGCLIWWWLMLCCWGCFCICCGMRVVVCLG